MRTKPLYCRINNNLKAQWQKRKWFKSQVGWEEGCKGQGRKRGDICDTLKDKDFSKKSIGTDKHLEMININAKWTRSNLEETKKKIVHMKGRSRLTKWSRKSNKWARICVWFVYINLKFFIKINLQIRKIWDKIFSPSLVIELQGLRQNYSSIQIEKTIHLHSWKNQPGQISP